MAKGKGATPAAPAPAAPAAPAAAPGQFSTPPGKIPTIPAPVPTLGGKTEAQVKDETAALIAESMADIADDPNPWGEFEAHADADDKAAGKGKDGKGKGKTGKGKKDGSERAEAAESDTPEDQGADEGDGEEDDSADDADEADADEEAEEVDEEEAEEEGDEEEEEHDGKAFAGKRKALKKREERARAHEAKNEQDAQLLTRLFGNSLEARKAAERGDREAARKFVEIELQEVTGMTLEEAIVFLVDPNKAPSEADLKLRKIEKERAAEREEKARREAAASQAQATQDLHTWIKTELGTDPKLKRLLQIPNFVQNAGAVLVAEYKNGVTTPRKAAAVVQKQLLQMHKALTAAFGAGEQEDAPGNNPSVRRRRGKHGRGSPPRANAAGNASENARPMTTGDAIAEALAETGIMKSTDRRLENLRGKKVGVA